MRVCRVYRLTVEEFAGDHLSYPPCTSFVLLATFFGFAARSHLGYSIVKVPVVCAPSNYFYILSKE